MTRHQYGALSVDAARYPLVAVTSHDWDPNLPSVLVTGGVHGYETSGVQGACRFLATSAAAYAGRVNLCVIPCVSPWGYEHVERWNPQCKDPNRSFKEDAKTEESSALMAFLTKIHGGPWAAHVDLHETTDTDETEFMPARAAEKGETHKICAIPDGFYLVGDAEAPAADFQAAILESVARVTHVAPADADGMIIDEKIFMEGLVVVPARDLGLCCAVTRADLTTTTEVYPDSSNCTAAVCDAAQVAAVDGALGFLLAA